MKLLLTILFLVINSFAKNDAVILLYHHVSDTTPASTSVSIDIFKKHLDYLDDNNFTVLPLEEVLFALDKGENIPPKSVVITFDDAYESILHNALPLLKEKEYPFTVFINTKSVESRYRNILSWDELKILQKNNATIANHTHTHTHMVRFFKNESKKHWVKRIQEDIQMAQKIIKDKLGTVSNLFAYPYGEYNEDVKKILKELGYFGVAQQSGPISVGFNKFEVPRFPMAMNYSNMKRFTTSINSKQLPLKNMKIGSKILREGETNKNIFSFELTKGNYIKRNLACFSNSGEKLDLKIEGMKVSMALPSWKAGRKKINCTVPSKTFKGVFYWYSQLWLIKNSNGSWYKE